MIGFTPDVPEDEIRHAYLHFILDPLTLQYRKESSDQERASEHCGARSRVCPVEYHDDFLSFADECLIQAVELRLRNLSSANLESALQNADQVRFHPRAAHRPAIAKVRGRRALRSSYYFPDLIKGIDVAAEQKRAQNIYVFCRCIGFRAGTGSALLPRQGASELDVWLAEGDRDIASQNAAAAEATFEKVLAKYPNQPRATYGLAIASVLSGNADRAEQLFT